jgi:hypothetical protein
MRTALLVVAVMFLSPDYLMADAPKDIPSLTTNDGRVYKNVHVNETNALGIKAMWDGGIGTITFDQMPADLAKQFGYDKSKFAAAQTEQAQHDAQSDALAAQGATLEKQRNEAEAKQEATQTQAKADAPNPQTAKWLAGTVQETVTGGYAIQLPPMPQPIGDGLTPVHDYSYHAPPHPIIGYNLEVVLKTDAVLTVGQSVRMSVIEQGVYTDESGNHFRAFSELAEATR